MDTYYNPEDLAKFGTIGEKAPELAEKFFSYYNAVFEEGRTTESINEEAGVKTKEIEAVFQDEMLLMCPENERMLDQALLRMRKEKVQVPLKAVLTEMNKNWTSVALHDEIMREHEKMTGGK